MELKILILFVVLALAVVSLGCIGGEKQTPINSNVSHNNEMPVTNVTTSEKQIYQCPLDSNKINYDCETDADCKMVTCHSGAGDVDACVSVDSGYEGVHSTHCVCKVTGTYTSFENGTTTTGEIKNCKHI